MLGLFLPLWTKRPRTQQPDKHNKLVRLYWFETSELPSNLRLCLGLVTRTTRLDPMLAGQHLCSRLRESLGVVQVISTAMSAHMVLGKKKNRVSTDASHASLSVFGQGSRRCNGAMVQWCGR